MFRIGKVISYDDAAKIVGNYFPEVNDKLLNLLQLQQNGSSTSDSLLSAAIAQKTAQLSVVPFVNAVDLKANRKYIKFAAIPTIVILLLLIFSPTLLTRPSHRITHYTTEFHRPAPFTFIIENESLQVSQHEDFTLNVAVQGDVIPSEAFINIEGNVYRMQQVDKTHYSYLFKTVQRRCSFQFQSANVVSQSYILEVFPKPSIVDFQVTLSYPPYTKKTSETVANEGNLVVPQGTIVKWHFHTQAVDTIHLFVNEDNKQLLPDQNGKASYTCRVMHTIPYGFYAANNFSPHSDSLKYTLTAIEDALPMISVVEQKDSLLPDRVFFTGRIKDDYGFSKLDFLIVKTNVKDTSSKEVLSQPVAITSESVQEFYYSYNMAVISLNPGDKLTYYFQLWDNDAIHGPKSVTSQKFELLIPTEEQLDNIIDRNSAEAQQHAKQSVSELKKMQDDISELLRKLVDKNELSWQDKKELQQLSKQQQQIKSMLQQMQQQLKENKMLEQKYKDQSEKLLQKQQELDRLMNEVMNDEMKKMMEEMDKLMQEMDKKKVQEKLDQIKMDNADLEKQLDQNIELMKRLELEKKVEDAISKTEKLAENQRDISNQSKDLKNKEQRESILHKQEDLSKQFDALKQEIKDIQKEYKDLDDNLNFKVDNELLKDIDNKQNQSEESLRKGDSKGASQNQKGAADELDQLSEQLAESQQDIEQESLAEDAEMIRQLLKNLVKLSFSQESLISQSRNTYIQDPLYQDIINSQNKIKSDFRPIEDSLRSIAKRQVQVAQAINKNVDAVNSNISRSLRGLLDMNQSFYGTYKNTQATTFMQYSMTSFNNLALVMAESLDQMQNQMRQNQQKKKNGSCKNQGMKKAGNCSNPGKGKPSPKSMKQMQQELNKQMESLRKQLEKQGNNNTPGRKKLGDKGNAQLSEEFARMAAQQEMIRRMMQRYGQELKQSDASNSKLAKEIDQILKQMEQTETDLVNKVITNQTIQRQRQIMTRMLEHEKAETEREKEEKRQSREGKEQTHQLSPSDLEKLRKLQEKNLDLFRTVPPALSPYYKYKVNDYFYNL